MVVVGAGRGAWSRSTSGGTRTSPVTVTADTAAAEARTGLRLAQAWIRRHSHHRASSGSSTAIERRRSTSGRLSDAQVGHCMRCPPASRASWRRRSPMDRASSTGRQRAVGSSTRRRASR